MAEAPNFVILSQPNGPVAEAYRSLRVALQRKMVSGQGAFTVASSFPGDGKSMVCSNLAIAMTQLHLRVLLIDADIRSPTLSKVFGARELPGLTNILEGSLRAEDSVHETELENLFFLPSGSSKDSPSNLLGREKFPSALAYFRNTYDCILVDTPPLSACSDTLLIGVHTDGAILVVNPKNWVGEVELRYKQQIDKHGIELLGTIINGASLKDSTHYGYGYGYGKGYGYGYGYAHGSTTSSKQQPPTRRWFQRGE
ncbi:CpsD/CapB family tyrosine-protein kinase [bacterium]|nr:CpsD/CapB family tyrosine-protein kinase [bacterium]